jgi:hypothetical protein
MPDHYRPAWLLATASPLTKPSWLWRLITKGITAMTKPTINVSVYGENAPAGAIFGKGAKDLASIKEMTDARHSLSEKQSTPTRGPLRND